MEKGFGVFYAGYTISLTEKGRTFVVQMINSDSNAVYVRTAEPILLKITGVTPATQGAGAPTSTVTFDWQYKLTPFGEAQVWVIPIRDPGAGSKARKGTATFILFDDGWRIKQAYLE